MRKIARQKIASMGKLRKHPSKNPKQKHPLLQKKGIASMGKLRKHPSKNPKQKHSLLQRKGVPYSKGSSLTISTVLRLTVMTRWMRSTM